MAKDFLGNLGQALSKTAKELSGRAEDAYETQRLKNKISAEERQIDKIMADLGKIVYRHYKEEVPVDDAQKALCEQIDQRMEQIEQLRTDINDLSNEHLPDKHQLQSFQSFPKLSSHILAATNKAANLIQLLQTLRKTISYVLRTKRYQFMEQD